MHDEPSAADNITSDAPLGLAEDGGASAAAHALTSDATLGRAAEPTRRRRITVPESAALVVVLGLLVLFFSVKSPVFFTWDNFINILISVAPYGILACPATMLLIAGQFDLSVGSGSALVGCIFANALAHHWGVTAAVFVALGVGLGGGILNGFLVTVVGINALITTLGTLAIYSGLAFISTNGLPIQFDGFTGIGIGAPFARLTWGVLIFFGIILVSVAVMRATVFGRSLYAIGSNSVAARLAGIRVGRTVFWGFVLSGLAVAITGLVLASSTGQGSGSTAQGYELSVVTAVILGGASLAGGRGAIFGTIIGLIIIGVINNGLTLLNIQSFWQDVVRGTLLIAAVGFDVVRLRLTKE